MSTITSAHYSKRKFCLCFTRDTPSPVWLVKSRHTPIYIIRSYVDDGIYVTYFFLLKCIIHKYVLFKYVLSKSFLTNFYRPTYKHHFSIIVQRANPHWKCEGLHVTAKLQRQPALLFPPRVILPFPSLRLHVPNRLLSTRRPMSQLRCMWI